MVLPKLVERITHNLLGVIHTICPHITHLYVYHHMECERYSYSQALEELTQVHKVYLLVILEPFIL